MALIKQNKRHAIASYFILGGIEMKKELLTVEKIVEEEEFNAKDCYKIGILCLALGLSGVTLSFVSGKPDMAVPFANLTFGSVPCVYAHDRLKREEQEKKIAKVLIRSTGGKNAFRKK